jgi:hypothetical protein
MLFLRNMVIETDVPRENPSPEITPRTPAIDNIFRERKFPITTFIQDSGFHSGPISGRSYRRSLWSLAATIIDGLIVTSLGCFFIVAFALIVNSNMKVTLSFFDGSFTIFGAVVFTALAMIYTIMLRSFLGYSIGEWACGLRLGLPNERLSRKYSLRVIMRTLAIFFTGIIVLPILSIVTGYDMAGRLTGIYLFKID